MNSFYTILYVPIRPEVKEILTVGLVMRSEKEVIFRYSKNKLSVLKELLPKEPYNLLKLSLQSIERATISAKEDFENISGSLPPESNAVSNMFDEPYIKYLSAYSKNLLAFTTPQYINVPVTFDLFQTLFEKLISEGEFISIKNEEHQNIVMRTRELLFPKIDKRVNINFSVTPKHFKSLIIPSIKVDFIGKNGMYVTGQAINFEKKENFLEADITRQIALIDAMDSEHGGSTCFLLGKEPDKIHHPEQHTLWQNVCNSKALKFVDADEYESVSKYITEHNVQPLIPLE